MVTNYEKECRGVGLVQICDSDPNSMESQIIEILLVVKVLCVSVVTKSHRWSHNTLNI